MKKHTVSEVIETLNSKMTQEEISQETGIPQSTISRTYRQGNRSMEHAFALLHLMQTTKRRKKRK